MPDLTILDDDTIRTLNTAATSAWRTLADVADDDDRCHFAAAMDTLSKAGFEIEDQYDADEAQDAIMGEMTRRRPAPEPAADAWDFDRYVSVLQMAADRAVHVGRPASRNQIVKLAGLLVDHGKWGAPFGSTTNAQLSSGEASRMIDDVQRQIARRQA